MSKIITFKGSIIPGTDPQRIKLSTLKGKTGYRVKKFQIIGSLPGQGNEEYICQLHKKSTGASVVIDFTNDALIGVVYDSNSAAWGGTLPDSAIIVDNRPFNQDIYVSGVDVAGGTTPFNFYLELETVKLNDVESTMLTLSSIRDLASR